MEEPAPEQISAFPRDNAEPDAPDHDPEALPHFDAASAAPGESAIDEEPPETADDAEIEMDDPDLPELDEDEQSDMQMAILEAREDGEAESAGCRRSRTVRVRRGGSGSRGSRIGIRRACAGHLRGRRRIPGARGSRRRRRQRAARSLRAGSRAGRPLYASCPQAYSAPRTRGIPGRGLCPPRGRSARRDETRTAHHLPAGTRPPAFHRRPAQGRPGNHRPDRQGAAGTKGRAHHLAHRAARALRRSTCRRSSTWASPARSPATKSVCA